MASVPPALLGSAAKLLNRSPLRRPTAAVLDFLTRNPSPLAFVESTAARAPGADVGLDANATPYVVRFEPTMQSASGPIAGATFVVKDSLDVAGEPTTLGLRHRQPLAARDAVIVANARKAGGVLIGKTKMTELGMDGLGAAIYGEVPPNPHSPGYFAGGSSTGTAIAVASGEARFGIGGDGMGSVRIPSAFCGLVGLKPGHEALSHEGYRSPAPSMDVPGPMAKTAADVALFHQVLEGVSPRVLDAWAPSHVGVLHELGPELATRSIARAFHRALHRLGTPIERVHVPLAAHATVLGTVVGTGEIASSDYAAGDLSAAGKLNVALGRAFTDDDRRGLTALRDDLRTQVMRVLDRMPVLAMPTTAVPAPALRRSLLKGAQDVPLLLAVGAYTPLANLTGLPAITVPSGVDSRGRSLGIMFVGRPGSEHELLKIALAVEATGVGRELA